MSLSKHHFVIADNSRLAFEGAAARVRSFVAARLGQQSTSYEFCDDWATLEARVRTLSTAAPDGIEYVVLMDLMSPFTDLDLVVHMTEVLSRTGQLYARCDGAVPGTEVHAILPITSLAAFSPFALSSLDSGAGTTVRWETQSKYNNQLNLYKYKRIKIFLALTERFDDLPHLSLSALMARLAEDDAFVLLSTFGDGLRQFNYNSCPHCNGHIEPLPNTMSQPFCGYLPVTRPVYHECEACGLVVQSPSVHEDDVQFIYDKWDKQDFVASTNNPYTSDSIRCDLSKILHTLPTKTRTLDLGGGIGNFSKFLRTAYPEWDVTHSDFEIKAIASEGVRARALDFTREPIGRAQYELITAWEVIEHVPYHKLRFVFENIAAALAPGGYFVFSTPDFDSPVCKSFDFYALCPPFHYLVFGERWLRNYFLDSKHFEIFDVKHCSDFLDDALNWYGYGGKTCPSMAIRSTADLLRAVFEMDVDKKIRNRLAADGFGTEIIMTLRKKNS
ncbi:MAG: class I SAM-dependent methyltransferase [Gammaproteobacteria bacterium]|nr:class I SAM-dependent methyltransferase [Gammaproteobacteria bacterium]